MFRTMRFVGTVALVVCLPAILALGWWQRDYLMGWYLAHQLVMAKPEEKNHLVESLSKLGEHAQYPLLDYLETSDAKSAPDLCFAIGAMMDHWGGLKSKASQEFYHHLARRFQNLPDDAKTEVLRLMLRMDDSQAREFTPAKDLSGGTRWILGIVAKDGKAPALHASVSIVAEILKTSPDREFQAICADIVSRAIQAGDEDTKVRAIQLAIQPETGMVDLTVQALQDPSVQVRKSAMLACAPALESISVDVLLPSLHDTDSEIRSLCETALGARGLRPEHIKLGKLITDSNPAKRLEVLDYMLEDPELDQSVWLRKLSHDPSAAVRVGALRAMAAQTTVDMSDRIDQMSRTDPSKTVVELASYYQKMARKVQAAETSTTLINQ